MSSSPIIKSHPRPSPGLILDGYPLKKLASTNPATLESLGEVYREAGLPAGALNVVNTRAAQAEYMITHPTVQTVMFTGSVGIGRRVMELAAKNPTHIVLELGGKDPMIVLDDADLDFAARGAVWAAFMNTGQSCASIERVYVDEKIAEAFTAKVLDLAKSLRVGNPLDPDVDVGPMTTKDQRETVEEHIRDARSRPSDHDLQNSGGSGFMKNAVVLLHHRKLGAKFKSLGALLPQWRAIKAGNSLKNLWKFTERFFRR